MRKEAFYLLARQVIRKATEQIVVTIEARKCLSTAYRNVSDILLSRLTSYDDDVIGHCHSGLGRNR